MKRIPGCNAVARHVHSSSENLSNTLIVLQRTLEFVVDTLLPQDCFLCGSHAGGGAICPACAAQLPSSPEGCPVCAVPVPGGGVCGRCLREPPAFDASTARYRFDFPVDAMVHALKYRHRLALAAYFAQALSRAGLPQADLVLPMPLHARRLAERGFNQAVEIARPLARELGVGLDLTSVRRLRDTAAQAGLTREERQRNLRGAFVSESRFDGLRVLVVDDVMTTGASLDALAAVLKRQGAARVENLLVARTPPPG